MAFVLRARLGRRGLPSLCRCFSAASVPPTVQSVNPTSGAIVATYPLWNDDDAAAAAERAAVEFRTSWRKTTFAERSAILRSAATLLRARKQSLSELMAVEMGKPLGEGGGEIEKSASILEYYAARAEEFLTPELVTPEAAMAALPGSRHMVKFTPLGTVLAVMPWNFPFWQVFRQAATALSAGNTMLLKHAPNVFGAAFEIERIFRDAGLPHDAFQTVPISNAQTERLINHPAIKAVAFTGSTPVGQKVGGIAGAKLKPHVLELGGSDAYVILEDADLEQAVAACAAGRLLNCGQSCIGAKRFVVVAALHDAFLERIAERMGGVAVVDPLDPKSGMGPMVSRRARDSIHAQVSASVAQGAKVAIGGEVPPGPGAFYPPTVLFDVGVGQPAYHEELFGPVASVIKAEDEVDAIRIANDTSYGLGAAVFTRDTQRGERIASEELEAGLCFVNDFVKSHQALPFGGVKQSGVGRECASYGIKEFVNVKTVVVK